MSGWRAEGRFYAVLKVLGQGLGALRGRVKDVGAVVAAARVGVLVDAEQGAPLHLPDGGHPVLQIGALLLPQSIGVSVVEGDVRLPEQDGVHPVQAQHIPQLEDNGQINLALRRPGEGNRAPVLSAVAGVNYTTSSLSYGGRLVRYACTHRRAGS